MYALLFVEHGVKQIVGVDEAFHYHVGASGPYLGHGLAGGIVGVGGLGGMRCSGVAADDGVNPGAVGRSVYQCETAEIL